MRKGKEEVLINMQEVLDKIKSKYLTNKLKCEISKYIGREVANNDADTCELGNGRRRRRGTRRKRRTWKEKKEVKGENKMHRGNYSL